MSGRSGFRPFGLLARLGADPLDSQSGLVVRLVGGRGPEDLRFAAATVPEVTVITWPGSQIEVRQGLAALVAG